jgi:hypothetical protein
MDHHEILNIGVLANLDLKHLGPHYHARPNGTAFANRYLAVQQRAIVDEGEIVQCDIGSNMGHRRLRGRNIDS